MEEVGGGAHPGGRAAHHWRGLFGKGRNSSGGTTTVPIEWPGFKTTAWRAKAPTQQATTNWMGSLIGGMRDPGGQMYMRNRYYDPQTGQFTQTDPIGLAGGLNTYGFAAGDPVTYRDPYGLEPQCDEMREAEQERLCPITVVSRSSEGFMNRVRRLPNWLKEAAKALGGAASITMGEPTVPERDPAGPEGEREEAPADGGSAPPKPQPPIMNPMDHMICGPQTICGTEAPGIWLLRKLVEGLGEPGPQHLPTPFPGCSPIMVPE